MSITPGIIKKAIEEAESSEFYPFKIGAVIFKGKRILSSGKNGIRSSSIHPKYKNYLESLHAEQNALIGLNWNHLKGCSILVIRINRNGELTIAKPCKMCMALLNYVGIKKIYYSDSDGTIKKIKGN